MGVWKGWWRGGRGSVDERRGRFEEWDGRKAGKYVVKEDSD